MNAHSTTLMSDRREMLSEGGSRALVDEYASLIKRYDLLEPDARAAARTALAGTSRPQRGRCARHQPSCGWRQRSRGATSDTTFRLPILSARPISASSSRLRILSPVAAPGFPPMRCGGSRRRSTITSCGRVRWSRSGRRPAQRKLFFGFRRAMNKLRRRQGRAYAGGGRGGRA